MIRNRAQLAVDDGICPCQPIEQVHWQTGIAASALKDHSPFQESSMTIQKACRCTDNASTMQDMSSAVSLPPQPAEGSSVVSQFFGMLCAGAVVGAVGIFVWYGGNFANNQPDRAQLLDEHLTTRARQDICGLPGRDGRATTIEMVHSDEIRDWIDLAAERFSYLCPNIQVKLTALSDIEATHAIATQRVKPTIWAPNDEFGLRYFEHYTKQFPTEPPIGFTDRTDLVQSPIVVMMWQDRLRMLTKLLSGEPSPDGQWSRSLCALIPKEPLPTEPHIEDMVPGRWADWYGKLLPANALENPLGGPLGRGGRRERLLTDDEHSTLGELQQWGRVKIGHPNPGQDSVGLAALYLLAYDYVLPSRNESSGNGPALSESLLATTTQSPASAGPLAAPFEEGLEAKKAAFRKWLRRCEAGLDAAPRNARSLTEALSYGPARYDGVVTYEHLALPYFERVDSHPDGLHKLVLIYPNPTLLERHPAVILSADPAQRLAAQRWIHFLIGAEMQRKAVDVGLRPVNPQVSVRDAVTGSNPFLRLRRYGVQLQPSWKEAPRASGKVVQELIELWSEATGRH